MMRKYSFLTIILCAGLLMNGCSEDQYAVEKRYWQLKKQAEQILQNPEVSPPNELKRAIDATNSFIARYPKNILAMESKFLIAKLYLAKKEFNQGREQLQQIMSEYKSIPPVCSEALFLIGSSYQLQNNWAQALEQYRKVYRDYPLTERGFEAPMYIAMYYKAKFMPDKMIDTCNEAIAHFRGLMAKYPDPKVAFRAYNYIGSCYVAMKKWPEAVQNLQGMATYFKDKLDTGNLYINIALIYANELKDAEQAKQVLQKFISDNPKSKFIQSAEKLLAAIEKGK